MKSLESRLKTLEEYYAVSSPKIYIFTVGNHESCDFGSETEYEKEIQKSKYKNAIVIRDLDKWIEN